MKNFSLLLLALFGVPILALVMACVPFVQQLGVSPLDVPLVTKACLTGDYTTFEMRDVCDALKPFNYMGLGAIAAIIAGLLFLISIKLVAIISGTNRATLALAFPITAFSSMIGIAVLTLLQGALLAAVVYLVQAYFFGAILIWLVLIAGFGGLMASIMVFIKAFAVFKQSESEILGLKATEENFPGLMAMIDDIAKQVGTRAPHNVVLGMDPTFYVTSAKGVLQPSFTPLKGRTLFLSLPLLRLLNRDELRGIIGHELGHFSGGDTFYSKRFAPAYRSLGQTAYELTEAEEVGLFGLPVAWALHYVIGSFAKPERRIGRKRELRADQVGASVSSPQAMATGLAKFSVLDVIWGAEFEHYLGRMHFNRMTRNLPRNFAEAALYDINYDAASDLAAQSLAHVTVHPVDTHPPTRMRIEHLGQNADELVSPEVFRNSLRITEYPIDNVHNLDALEEELTGHFNDQMGRLIFRKEQSEVAEVNAWLDFLAIGFAKMVVADGVIDEREIREAAEAALGFEENFDVVAFRQFCRHPDEMPTTEDFIREANLRLTPSGVIKFIEGIDRVANADGELHPSEAALLDAFRAGLTGRPEIEAGSELDQRPMVLIKEQDVFAAKTSSRRRRR